MLLLHGWGSSAGLMQPIAEGLATTCRVHNLDMPGHGHSPLPPAAIGVPEHAELVEEYILTEMGGGPVTIIGHSNGGRIALLLAATKKSAGLIRSLALISPSGITPTRSASVQFKRVVAKILRAPARIMPRAAADLFQDWITHSLIWRAIGSSDYNALTGVMRETFVKTVNFHVDDIVHNITCPVLVLWGSRDTAVDRSQMTTLERLVPDCALITLEGAGHYGHLDALPTVVGACRSLLAPTTKRSTVPA